MTFTCKPVFIGWITLLCQLPLQLFFTFWCGGFFGGFSMVMFYPAHSDSRMPFILFGGLAFFGFPAISYFGKKFNYAKTHYNFYDDRLEFEEGFFTINKKIIKYKDIKEVNLRKGMLQRMYGLGSIYLATTATGSLARGNTYEALGFGNISGSGVGVRDIRNPDAAYEKIKILVDSKNV